MIEIKIDLVPYGIETRRINLIKAVIINDGTGSYEIGNYQYSLKDDKGNTYKGEIKEFPRTKKDILYLLKDILNKELEE